MADYNYHHFVPRFYLKAWTTNSKLTLFELERDSLNVREVGTKREGGRKHLYSLRHARKDRQVMEREFMTRQVDNPAAVVYHHIVNGADSKSISLSRKQRSIWTRFLISLRVRMPDVIDRLRVDAEIELRRHLLDRPAEYEAIRGRDDPEKFGDCVEQRWPGFVADFGIRMLPSLIDYPPIAKKIFRMHWWTQDLSRAAFDLLTSDRPLVLMPSLDAPTCVMALPLTPKLAFLATHSPAHAAPIRALSPNQVVRAINQDIVGLAKQQVYATNRDQTEFVRRRLNAYKRPARDHDGGL